MNFNPLQFYKYVKYYTTIKKSGLFDSKYYLFTYPDVRRKDIDPLMHYIRYGAKEGRNPSADFSTNSYVAMHKYVDGKKMNPLYHYIVFGKKEGRIVFESTKKNKNSPKPNKQFDILFVCWLGSLDKLLYGLIVLEKTLKLKGIKTSYVVGNTIVEEFFLEKGVNDVSKESLLITKNRKYINKDTNQSLLKHQGKKLNLLENNWKNTNTNYIKVIESVYVSLKNKIIQQKIKHIVVWGNTAPMSQLYILICEELDIDYTVLERGHFDGTLFADCCGQFGFSSILKNLNAKLIDSVDERSKTSKMEEILKFLDVADNSYSHKNLNNTPEINFIKERKLENKKILVFLGANDKGSGFKKHGIKNKANTWFESTQEVLNAVATVHKNNFSDCILVIKPHPANKLSILFDSTNIIVTENSSILELIQLADVCLNASSTVGAYCLALGKPTLQFGITDLSNSKELYHVWHPSVISSYLRDALEEQFLLEKNQGYSNYVLDLFSNRLISVDDQIPTNLRIQDFSEHLFNRVHKSTKSYDYEIAYESAKASKKLYADISTRGRKYYDVNLIDSIDEKELPKVAIIIPVYDDLVGLRRNVERVVKYRGDNNNYAIVLIWDCGPDIETLEYCREAKEKYGIDLIENKVNIGFSGTVNKGILKYKTHDVIVHNSDTIVHGDWAIRMQKSAYVDEEIGSVNPLSNNATINNVPFPNGMPFPQYPVKFVEFIDSIAKAELNVAVEVPVFHGFCVFIKRSTIDIVGLFDEQIFGKGYGEDNEYSMRIRSKGFKCVTTTNVFVGHDGSTSFKEEVIFWKLHGRYIMNKSFPFYMNEIKDFFNNDPIVKERNILESHFNKF